MKWPGKAGEDLLAQLGIPGWWNGQEKPLRPDTLLADLAEWSLTSLSPSFFICEMTFMMPPQSNSSVRVCFRQKAHITHSEVPPIAILGFIGFLLTQDLTSQLPYYLLLLQGLVSYFSSSFLTVGLVTSRVSLAQQSQCNASFLLGKSLICRPRSQTHCGPPCSCLSVSILRLQACSP